MGFSPHDGFLPILYEKGPLRGLSLALTCALRYSSCSFRALMYGYLLVRHSLYGSALAVDLATAAAALVLDVLVDKSIITHRQT